MKSVISQVSEKLLTTDGLSSHKSPVAQWQIIQDRPQVICLHSKLFRLVSEQKKTEERDFWFQPRKKWNESHKNERGGRGRGRKVSLPLFSTPSPLFYSRHFSHGLCSLLRNRVETLATNANRSQVRLLLTEKHLTTVCTSFDFGKLVPQAIKK